jgi:hypothetical protein
LPECFNRYNHYTGTACCSIHVYNLHLLQPLRD